MALLLLLLMIHKKCNASADGTGTFRKTSGGGTPGCLGQQMRSICSSRRMQHKLKPTTGTNCYMYMCVYLMCSVDTAFGVLTFIIVLVRKAVFAALISNSNKKQGQQHNTTTHTTPQHSTTQHNPTQQWQKSVSQSVSQPIRPISHSVSQSLSHPLSKSVSHLVSIALLLL